MCNHALDAAGEFRYGPWSGEGMLDRACLSGHTDRSEAPVRLGSEEAEFFLAPVAVIR
jgi:hypothetical protein